MLNVTDLSAYLYCPRQFYLTKVIGLRQPLTKPMVEGSLRHRVRENFANKEEFMFQNLELINHELTKEKITSFYQNLLDEIIRNTFNKSQKLILGFEINTGELREKIIESMKNEINLRSAAVANTIQKGFTGKQLWENLTPKYISEMPLASETLGLRGRADRILINKEEDSIIPFELKTRAEDKIWPSDEIQLTAYAMLLEEKYNKPIPLAILEAGNTTHELAVTEQNKQKVKDLIFEINQLLESSKSGQKVEPKFPSSFAKCQHCDWEEHCQKIGED